MDEVADVAAIVVSDPASEFASESGSLQGPQPLENDARLQRPVRLIQLVRPAVG